MDTDTIDIRVRYAETDQMGVVFNANLLVYFEVARTEYMRGLDTAYRDMENDGYYLMVSEAHCKYTGPAEYDDVLEITTWVDRVRPMRIDFRHQVRRRQDGAPVAEGHVVLACVDGSLRPQALPAEVREKLTRKA